MTNEAITQIEAAPYLYNPVTGRVMINTPLKRKVCPNLLPCDTLGGPERFQRVDVAQVTPPKVEATPVDIETPAEGPEELLAEIEAMDDRDELIEVAQQMGLDIGPKMNKKTIKSRLRNFITDLAE